MEEYIGVKWVKLFPQLAAKVFKIFRLILLLSGVIKSQ